MLGSVKSHRSLVVEAGAEVAGSLISADALWIGRECRIRGPVLAERHMEIGCRTRCGSPDSLTTVSSLRVDAEEGAVFCGTLWAREVGRVVARR